MNYSKVRNRQNREEIFPKFIKGKAHIFAPDYVDHYMEEDIKLLKDSNQGKLKNYDLIFDPQGDRTLCFIGKPISIRITYEKLNGFTTTIEREEE